MNLSQDSYHYCNNIHPRMKENEMEYVEVNVAEEMYKFEVGKPIEGEYTEVKQEVGVNKSNIYKVGDLTFWGTSALDLLMSKVVIGDKLRITLTDEDYKFPSGQSGRNFKVEVGK